MPWHILVTAPTNAPIPTQSPPSKQVLIKWALKGTNALPAGNILYCTPKAEKEDFGKNKEIYGISRLHH